MLSYKRTVVYLFHGLPRWLSGKDCLSVQETRDVSLITGSGGLPGGGNGNSSILAWKIPWTEEPGELQSMGSQRVGCMHMDIYKYKYIFPPELSESKLQA